MLELGGICKAGKTRILGSQATEKRCAHRTVGIGVLSVTAPRDTFTGVGVGRKTGSEAGEAIRWGHFFPGDPASALQSSTVQQIGVLGRSITSFPNTRGPWPSSRTVATTAKT